MITCDVAIVGGGLSGLYAARLLRKASIDVMLIEAQAHLALQLHIALSFESMGNHDSGYDEWRRTC